MGFWAGGGGGLLYSGDYGRQLLIFGSSARGGYSVSNNNGEGGIGQAVSQGYGNGGFGPVPDQNMASWLK